MWSRRRDSDITKTTRVFQQSSLAVALEGSLPATVDPLTCLLVQRGNRYVTVRPSFCLLFPHLFPPLRVCLHSPCVRRALRKLRVTEGQCHYSAVTSPPVSCCSAARFHCPPPTFTRLCSRYPFTDESVGGDATFQLNRKVFLKVNKHMQRTKQLNLHCNTAAQNRCKA